MTTVHSRDDIRIRRKEAASLAEAMDHAVCIFVQDGDGDETDTCTKVRIVDVGAAFEGRLGRMTGGAVVMWRMVAATRPLVAHFHDPELIPVGIALKLSGIRVIYDVHEDVPRQILDKHWIPPLLRRPVSMMVEGVEWLGGKIFDRVIAATPRIGTRFPSEKTVVVQNYPILAAFRPEDGVSYTKRPAHFAYVGGITRGRGVLEMIRAVDMVRSGEVRLRIAGGFQPPALIEEVEDYAGWKKVQYHGWISQDGVSRLLGMVRAGLVLFHPEQNHVESQPNKMFEYMAAGVPVIASDFPLWRVIIEESRCGLLADPTDPGSIAKAMTWMIEHPEDAAAMGRRGRRAVEECFNWKAESIKLVKLYRELIDA